VPDATAAADADAAPRPRSYKALVCDDNVAIRDIVRLTLERSGLGLSVVLAEDGNRALELAAIERPDIVILDLQMPGIDGFEVCRRLRSDVRTAFVPVIMLTAQSTEESVTKGFAAGTDDYVTKPFRRDDLVARVRRTLERTYGKGAVAQDREAAASGEQLRHGDESGPRDTAATTPARRPATAADVPPPADAAPARPGAGRVARSVAAGDGDAPPASAEAASSPRRSGDAASDAVAAFMARVESDLSELRARIEELRADQRRAAIEAVAPELDEIRSTLEQIRENHQQVVATLRESVPTERPSGRSGGRASKSSAS
jgi:DNA-binding response OmpR family regulator/predicted transcriptional regulator